MSKTNKPARPKLVASVQIMNFEPGTYTVDLAPQPVMVGQEGLAAPCARLDPLRRGKGGGTAHVAMLSDSAFIEPGAPPAVVRVGGRATVAMLMTVYRLEDAAAPELRVRQIGQEALLRIEAEPSVAVAVVPDAGRVLVHVGGQGDRSAAWGAWAGAPGSGDAIEGFSLMAGAAVELEYQAVLGREWDTPWFRPDEFCGSRGMALPLLGVRVRTAGETARTQLCQVWASFVGGGQAGPFAQGALCAADGLPIEALRVELAAAGDLAA